MDIAVEFAEWLVKHWKPNGTTNTYWTNSYQKSDPKYSTEELFKKFLIERKYK